LVLAKNAPDIAACILAVRSHHIFTLEKLDVKNTQHRFTALVPTWGKLPKLGNGAF